MQKLVTKTQTKISAEDLKEFLTSKFEQEFEKKISDISFNIGYVSSCGESYQTFTGIIIYFEDEVLELKL